MFSAPTPTRTVYVGNIPFSATQESLLAAFAEYQPVSAKVIEGKGVAFIEVPARRVFAMVRDTDGSKLEGRLLSVSIARPRANEPTLSQEEFREQEARDGDRRPSGRPYADRGDRPPRDFSGGERFRRDDRAGTEGTRRPEFGSNRPPRQWAPRPAGAQPRQEGQRDFREKFRRDDRAGSDGARRPEFGSNRPARKWEPRPTGAQPRQEGPRDGGQDGQDAKRKFTPRKFQAPHGGRPGGGWGKPGAKKKP